MSETMLPLVLDGLLVLLLLMTIVYVIVLNRKLSRLRGNHQEMEVFVEKLNNACNRAEAVTEGLRGAGENGINVFRDAASKAEALRDELVFLVKRADIVAERLATVSEGTKVVASASVPEPVRRAMERSPVEQPPVEQHGPERQRPEQHRSRRHQDAGEQETGGQRDAGSRGGARSRRETAFRRDEGRRDDGRGDGGRRDGERHGAERPGAPRPEVPRSEVPRSEAEEELLKALRNAR